MYRIKNITTGKVILGDLSISLNRGQEVDLDSLFPRAYTNSSRDLSNAISLQRRIISVIQKDPDPIIVPAASPQIDQIALENTIRKTIAEMENTNKNDTETKLNEILTALRHLPSQNQTQINDTGQIITDDINEDTSIDIQTKLLKRLTNNVASSVESKETTKDSADIRENADNLSKLLGEM